MHRLFALTFATLFVLLPQAAWAQRNPKKEAAFLVTRPVVGDPLPEVTVYTPDGKEFKTAELRGSYTVVTFGCLT